MPERWRTPFASSEAAHQKMSTLARRDTGPELALRRVLHRRGLRYRVHRRPLPDLARQADIVFTGAKVAVFVDGCFWHGCPEHGRCEHRTNGWYWPKKIEANKDRDRDTDERLASEGWIPLRIWEHEDPINAADRVAAAYEEQSGLEGIEHSHDGFVARHGKGEWFDLDRRDVAAFKRRKGLM